MDRRDDSEIAREVGFTALQVQRLIRLRQRCSSQGRFQLSTDDNHLNFVRWLVKTGKLSEQIAPDNPPPIE